jgi:ParB family transcriptional regulator, chromosome partitioning protein
MSDVLGRGLESLIPPQSGNTASGQALGQGGGGKDSGTSPVSSVGSQQPVPPPRPEPVAPQPSQPQPVEKTAPPVSPVPPEPVQPPPAASVPDQPVSELPQQAESVSFRGYDEEVKADEAIFQIEVERVSPNPFQPRKEFGEEALKELAQSIQEHGIIQPLVVTRIEEEMDSGTAVRYQLIAGERRWRAARLVGLTRVPAVVRSPVSNKSNLELALIENVQRADLNPLEAARAYSRLQDEFQLTQREIAARVGKSRESVANTLRLLSAPSFIQEALSAGKISESQARVLLSVDTMSRQRMMFDRILNQGMSVRALKASVTGGEKSPEEQYFAQKLEEQFGAPVQISKKGDKGKVVIRFENEDDFRSLLERILGQDLES